MNLRGHEKQDLPVVTHEKRLEAWVVELAEMPEPVTGAEAQEVCRGIREQAQRFVAYRQRV